MKGTYTELMSIEEFYQALFQDKAFFDRHGISHLRSTNLYFTPCDAQGNAITIRDSDGRTVEGYMSAGCYHSAADGGGTAGGLEPRTVLAAAEKGKARTGGKGDKRPFRP